MSDVGITRRLVWRCANHPCAHTVRELVLPQGAAKNIQRCLALQGYTKYARSMACVGCVLARRTFSRLSGGIDYRGDEEEFDNDGSFSFAPA